MLITVYMIQFKRGLKFMKNPAAVERGGLDLLV
jgi:hypothetical protein